VAAYQAPLLAIGSMAALELIRERVRWCEGEGVDILCCPEAVLGGLADYAPSSDDYAIDVDRGELAATLAPIASDRVTTIVGFTERVESTELCNSAAVFHKGAVAGVYRKQHPAIRKSIYGAGDAAPVFTIGELTFGILICNDSNHREPARTMAAQGAKALFVPTNNGLPLDRADVVADARKADIALAQANRAWIVRADVAGRTAGLMSYGSSAIVNPDGVVVQSARRLSEDLLVADLDVG
jgi:predicted amidohydrolase